MNRAPQQYDCDLDEPWLCKEYPYQEIHMCTLNNVCVFNDDKFALPSNEEFNSRMKQHCANHHFDCGYFKRLERCRQRYCAMDQFCESDDPFRDDICYIKRLLCYDTHCEPEYSTFPVDFRLYDFCCSLEVRERGEHWIVLVLGCAVVIIAIGVIEVYAWFKRSSLRKGLKVLGVVAYRSMKDGYYYLMKHYLSPKMMRVHAEWANTELKRRGKRLKRNIKYQFKNNKMMWCFVSLFDDYFIRTNDLHDATSNNSPTTTATNAFSGYSISVPFNVTIPFLSELCTLDTNAARPKGVDSTITNQGGHSKKGTMESSKRKKKKNSKKRKKGNNRKTGGSMEVDKGEQRESAKESSQSRKRRKRSKTKQKNERMTSRCTSGTCTRSQLIQSLHEKEETLSLKSEGHSNGKKGRNHYIVSASDVVRADDAHRREREEEEEGPEGETDVDGDHHTVDEVEEGDLENEEDVEVEEGEDSSYIYSEHDSELTENTVSSVDTKDGDNKRNEISILLPSINMIHCAHCGTPNADYLSNCDRCKRALVALKNGWTTPTTPTQCRPTKPPFSKSKRQRKRNQKKRGKKDSGWTCVECGQSNDGKRSQCKMCKESKQRSTFSTKCTKNSKRKKNGKIHDAMERHKKKANAKSKKKSANPAVPLHTNPNTNANGHFLSNSNCHSSCHYNDKVVTPSRQRVSGKKKKRMDQESPPRFKRTSPIQAHKVTPNALNPNAQEFTFSPEVLQQHLRAMSMSPQMQQLGAVPMDHFQQMAAMGGAFTPQHPHPHPIQSHPPPLPPQPPLSPITPMNHFPPNHLNEYGVQQRSMLIPRLRRYVNCAVNSEQPPLDCDLTQMAHQPVPYSLHHAAAGQLPPPLLSPPIEDVGGGGLSGGPPNLTPPPNVPMSGTVDLSAMPMLPTQQFRTLPLVAPIAMFPMMVPINTNPSDLQRQLSDMEATVQEELHVLDSLFPGFKPHLSQDAAPAVSGMAPDADGSEVEATCNANHAPLQQQQAVLQENAILHNETKD